MNNSKVVPYTGDALKKPEEALRYAYNFGIKDREGTQSPILGEDGKHLKEDIAPYLPDATLKEAVELMQILERPLLLRGEAGCGKTKVAQAYAYERYQRDGEDYRRYYFEWHIKSTSKAQDGLYNFDHIARLREANANRGNEAETTEDLLRYIELGPLGQAFLASKPGKPAILLIDEIDKADVDFPNDLLLELDEMRFKIKELKGDKQGDIAAEQRPLIFITSNQERELPQAFLRRCVFHFIQFPEHLLKDIMLANFPKLKSTPEIPNLADDAIQKFLALRKELGLNPTANKNVSTSELKDWMRILDHYYGESLDTTKSAKEKADILQRISLEGDKLPFHTALLKTENDLKSLKKFDTKPQS